MKKVLILIAIVLSTFMFTGCKKCKDGQSKDYRYVGVYLEIVKKDEKDRNLNDVNFKLYQNNEGYLCSKNSSQYDFSGSTSGPSQFKENDYLVNNFGMAYSLKIAQGQNDVTSVNVYPIVYNKENELIILSTKAFALDLEEGLPVIETYEKAYEFNKQIHHLRVLINITKKTIG